MSEAMTPDKELERDAEKAAIAFGFPQSDKEHFEATYWTLHNAFCDGYKEGARVMRESHEKEVGELKADVYEWKSKYKMACEDTDHEIDEKYKLLDRIKELEAELEVPDDDSMVLSIKNRISDEYRKYGFGLVDWTMVSAKKIYAIHKHLLKAKEAEIQRLKEALEKIKRN